MSLGEPDFYYEDLDDFTKYNSPSAEYDQFSNDVQRALMFNQINQYATNNDVPWDGASSGMASFWAYNNGSGVGYPLNQRSTTSLNSFWYFSHNTNGQTFFKMFTATGSLANSLETGTISGAVKVKEWQLWTVYWSIADEKILVWVDDAAKTSADTVTGTLDATIGTPPRIVAGALYENGGAGPYGGMVCRIRFWDDPAEPTQADIDEYWADELEAMVIPTITYEAVDLSDEAVWTRVGSPDFEADPVNTDCTMALTGDETDNMVTKDGEVSTGIDSFAVACYMKLDATADTQDGRFMAQYELDNNNDAQFEGFVDDTTGRIEFLIVTGLGPTRAFQTRTNSGFGGAIDSDTWIPVGLIVNEGHMQIIFDAQEDPSGYFSQDNAVGGGPGFTVTGSELAKLSLGARNLGGGNLHTLAATARPAVWDDKRVSKWQMIKWQEQQIALEGTNPDCSSGDGDGLTRRDEIILL